MIWEYIKSLYYYIRYKIKNQPKEDSLITIIETEVSISSSSK